MATTPLYTLEEINAEITQAKKDLASARRMLSYSKDSGGNQTRVQRENISALEGHLNWLQKQRMDIESPNSGKGLQAVTMRVPRHG